MTPKQEAFILTLAARLVGDDTASALVESIAATGALDTPKAASAVIDDLLARTKAMPKPEAPAVITPMPEAGHYAVEHDGALRFYAVREGRGRHAGRRFLNRFRSDWEDRVGRAEREAVIAAILADPQAARDTFARETVCCWVCGRRLTDPEARERGIGATCAKAA